MSYNYSYNVLINRLEAFAAGHFLIKRFTHGQIDMADQMQDDEYPFMHVTPDTIEPVQGGMQFGFHIIFADIPRDKEVKAEYQREVISDCVRLGQDLIAEVKNGLALFGFNVQLVNNPVFEPFMEEQKNTVTGVAFTLKLEVPWDWSACDIPAIWATAGDSTGGSGEPFALLLQTNNVDNQVQQVLNLVNGNNITIVDNGDGSVTINATAAAEGTVTSVGLTAPSAFNVSGSPITTSGTLAITGAGTSSEYIDGTGALQTFPNIPAAQVNSDWNSISGVSEILNKPTIPAAQVNSDWNAVSGVAEILNKPTIPAAQIQSDWNQANTSALDYIKNKPAIGTGSVTSVDATISSPANAAFAIAGTPVTSVGTIKITAQGTSSQYIDGTAALRTFPTIPTTLRDLITGVNKGDLIEWDGITWIVRSALTLDDLVGVAAPAPTNGQVLTYNSSTQLWYAATPTTASGTVTSVGLTMPAAFSVTGSPVTTSGTLAVTGAGTSAQYIDGTGALQTLPSGGIKHGTASGTDTYTVSIGGVAAYADGDAYLVRFTNGNTTACTLNINSIGAIPLYRNNDGALIGGDIWAGGEMLCIYNSTTNVFQCIGTSPNSLFAYVTNAEASTTITKGQPVYAFGGTGDRLKVKLAYNTSDATSAQTVGMVVSTSIAANQKGIIIVAGQLDNLSTLPTSTFADGDPIYLGATAGTITNVKPAAPNHLVYLGIVTTASPGSAGRMYVRVQNGYEMNELHDVQSSGAVNNDILYRDTAVNLWKPASIPTILGYTPVTNARTISTTSPLSGGGDLTANRTLSIADAVADGTTKGAAAFTAADFNSSSGVISLDYTNGQKASAAQPGFLSAADWSTFNTKPSTNQMIISAFPGTSQAASTTQFWAITGSIAGNVTELNRVMIMPCDGTLKNLYLRFTTAQSATGSWVFTLRKNGVSTAMTVTITSADGANVTKSDTTNTVAVTAGDRICLQAVNNATVTSGIFASLSLILER